MHALRLAKVLNDSSCYTIDSVDILYPDAQPVVRAKVFSRTAFADELNLRDAYAGITIVGIVHLHEVTEAQGHLFSTQQGLSVPIPYESEYIITGALIQKDKKHGLERFEKWPQRSDNENSYYDRFTSNTKQRVSNPQLQNKTKRFRSSRIGHEMKCNATYSFECESN